MNDFSNLVNQYGGKAASLLAQYQAGNLDLLLPFSLVQANKWESGKKPEFMFSKPQIIRGSAIGDERGLVDIIETKTNVSSAELNGSIDMDILRKKGLSIPYINSSLVSHGIINPNERNDLPKSYDPFSESGTDYTREWPMSDSETKQLIIALGLGGKSVIDDIIKQSRHPSIIDYANWEGNGEYSGVSSVIVQPFNKNNVRGSVVEHPNIKGHYLVNIVYDVSQCPNGIVDQFLTDEEGNIIVSTTIPGGSMESQNRDTVKKVVEMKKKSREAGFISPSYSSQVEFGFLQKQIEGSEMELYDFQTKPLNPILFYQEREFLLFDFDPTMNARKYDFNQFGRVPQGRTDLRIVKCEGETSIHNLHEILEKSKDKIPSVYVFNRSAINGGLPLEFQPNNMIGYVVPSDITRSGDSIEHGNFRWIQKANFSLLGQGMYLSNFTDGETFHLSK